MDPLLLEILKLIAREEGTGGHGVTAYKVMRSLNLYPSFTYKLFRKLERDGYIECVKSQKGRHCSLTLRGVLEVYKNDPLLRPYLYKTIKKLLNLKNADIEKFISIINKIFEILIKTNYYPVKMSELLGWCITNYHIYECRELVKEIVGSNKLTILVNNEIFIIKQNGNIYCSNMEKCIYSNGKNCSLCKYAKLIKEI